MTNQDLIQLSEQLPSLAKLKGVKLSYAVAKNFATVTSEIKLLSEEIKKIQVDHAKKDKDGNPVIKNNNYEMTNVKAFQEDYKKLMEIEVDINLHKVKIDDIPNDVSGEQMSVILHFLDDK